MPVETQWDEIAAEISNTNHRETQGGGLPHWSRLSTLASLDRRSEKRYAMVFPIRVHGFDCENHYFSQKTFTLDISAGGCRFALDTEVQRGSVVAVSSIPRDSTEAPVQKALYEVMWSVKTTRGWEVGARSMDRKNIWGMNFPEPPIEH